MDAGSGRDAAVGRRRAPAGLLGALALVVAVEAGVTRLPPGRLAWSFIPASWGESGRASAGPEVRAADVLVLGDSQVKCGVQPALLGASAYNLAVVGGQPASSYYLLARALKAGARPRAVVVDFFPGLLASDLRINTAKWPELLGAREAFDLLITTRDGKLVGPLLARVLVPTLGRREGIRAAVLAAVTGREERAAAEARAYRRNWRLNAGAHLLPDNPAFHDQAAGPAATTLNSTRRWKCKPENDVYVRRFLALAGGHGVRVYWMLPTVAPGLRAGREAGGLNAAYSRYVDAVRRGFPGLTLLDPDALLNDPAEFSDVYHLDRLGAARLSASVAHALADGQAGRVVLAPQRAEARGLEDVAQSADVLGKRVR